MNLVDSSGWLEYLSEGRNAKLFAPAIEKIDELIVSTAIQAAKLSFEQKIPMADCLIYTTARQYNAIVWTQDVDFNSLDGVKYFTK